MPLRVFHSPKEWRERLGPKRSPATLTVGNFDGLHLGHQLLLEGVVECARKLETLAAAVTFDPHPTHVLRPSEAPPQISTLAQRLAGFDQVGLDAALVIRFDVAFSELSPEDFVQQILVDTLRVRLIRVGENFRFGHRHAGDVALLRECAPRLGYEVELVPPVKVRDELVSSSAIREAVCAGRIARAARLLGRPFALTGHIQPGSGRGARLLVPTLNLAPEQELLPKVGVYATDTVVGGGSASLTTSRIFHSATNVGYRPTVDGTQLTIESHLFDFSAELKSGPMEIHFWKRLRDEKKFAGVEELREQIERDLKRARTFFRRLSQAEAKGLPGTVRDTL